MKNSLSFLLLAALLLTSSSAFAQFGEPPVEKKIEPRTLFEEGYKTGFGINLSLNDFGFGLGGQFRKGLNPYTEGLLTLKMMGLKDPTEQTFINYQFGFRTIPNKYRRAISIPMYLGLKKRFFAREISDDFRVFGALSGGPVFAISYAYFNDLNDNGFRENDTFTYGFQERTYDLFNGFKESDTHWGVGGEIQLGIDFGDNFANLSSMQFGYTFNYFDQGIQILEPNKPVIINGEVQFQENGFVQTEPANDPRKYFGSAQISFVFGWMW